MGDLEVTLRGRDQLRLNTLRDLEGGKLEPVEAASVLAISMRQLRTVRARFQAEGAAGLVHGNRGRRPANACPVELGDQVVAHAQATYTGFNQVHFTQLLGRDEGLDISRSTVRRILAAEGIAAPKPQRRTRHRRHRVRRAHEGAMIQMDASDHDWLEGRGPRLTLVGGIDDATGRVWAVFRPAEDLTGYLHVLLEIVEENGIPSTVYTDKHAIFLGTRRTPERVRRGTTRYATQFTKVLNALDIGLIQARSPAAKGRVERLWRTLQDRLVSELRAQQVSTFAGAQAMLQRHLQFHNRNFAVPALDPTPAWRSLPADVRAEDIICRRYSRVVTNANTVSVETTLIQIEHPAGTEGWARRRVEACHRLNGSWFVRFAGVRAPATEIAAVPERTAA